jgi:hypothetical protein
MSGRRLGAPHWQPMWSARCALLGLVASLAWAGCTPPRPVQPRASAPRPPSAFLPADLDLALRMDLDQLAAQLGADVVRRLVLEAIDGPDDADPGRPLLERTLARSDRLWLGVRSRGAERVPELMLLTHGQFASVLPDPKTGDAIWSASEDGPAPHFERQITAPGALTRLYPLGDGLLAWASAGEIAGLERRIAGSTGGGVRPPERGAISLAASAERLRERFSERFPELSQRFAGAELLSGYVERAEAGLRAEVTLQLGSPAQASEAADLVTTLLAQLARRGCLAGTLARSAQVSVFQSSVRAHAQLEAEQVSGLGTCILEGACCAGTSDEQH